MLQPVSKASLLSFPQILKSFDPFWLLLWGRLPGSSGLACLVVSTVHTPQASRGAGVA